MISKGFFEQLEIIAQEHYIEVEDVLNIVEIALIKACQLEGYKGEIHVEFNMEQKKIRIFETLYIVDEVDPEGPVGQITLEEGKQIRERIKVGSVIKREIPFSSIGRRAATRFKSIFNQNLKELSGKKACAYFAEKQGEMVLATVVRTTDRYLILNIGMDTESAMPLTETLPGETYEPGTTLNVCITKVEETGRGPRVTVSRAHKDIIKRLFEMYIPEVASGLIEVIAIARDPGSRTKIGVKSTNPNVDPKGACVGISGARIKQINAALNGERIDIFEWSDDPIKLIAEALTPAKVISVLLNEEEHKSVVIVPDQQFSLAIGKGGQNARLASQATGWKIDIKDESSAYNEGIRFKPNVY